MESSDTFDIAESDDDINEITASTKPFDHLIEDRDNNSKTNSESESFLNDTLLTSGFCIDSSTAINEEKSSSKDYSAKILELLSMNESTNVVDEDIEGDVKSDDKWCQYIEGLDYDENESEDDDDNVNDSFPAAKQDGDDPIYRGHWLSVHYALLLILTYIQSPIPSLEPS